MKHSVLSTVLLLALAGAVGAQSPDLHVARAAFKKALRAKSPDERRAGIEALVACRDPRAVDDVVGALEKVDQSLDRLEKKIVKTGKETAKAFRSVDKQGDSGRPVSAGTMNSALKKAKETERKLKELHAAKDGLLRWRSDLLGGCGRLLDSVDGAARVKHLHALVKEIESTARFDRQLLLLQVLGSSHSAEARDALVGMVASTEDGALRTAVIDELAKTPDERDAKVYAAALDDDVWPVRVSAARGLGALDVADAIPPLVGVLERAEGRFLEEVIEALEDHTGVTFHDNATLWREWWGRNETKIRGFLENASSDDLGKKLGAMLAIGDSGCLMGVRIMLAEVDLGPSARAGETVAAPKDMDKADEEALLRTRIEAVGKAIFTRPRAIRKRAVNELLLRPFSLQENLDQRLAYLGFLGQIRTDRIRRMLLRFAGERGVDDPKTGKRYEKKARERIRKAAVTALGGQNHLEAAASLSEVLNGFEGDEDLRLRAARALHRMRTKHVVAPLIKGLQRGEEAVKTACHEALMDITGEQLDPQYAPWRDWWRENGTEFKPRGVAVTTSPQEEADANRAGTRFYGIETRSKHMVFILDRSGSMNFEGGLKMDAAKKELINAITSLPEGATFNIVFYNSVFDLWKKGMTRATKASRKEAIAWVKRIEPMGATNIFDPLERAFELAGRGTHDKAYGLLLDTIFFMSDGLSNRGRIIDAQEILKQVARMNGLKKVKIHTIGIGKDHDPVLMKGLADLTGGTYVTR